MPEIDVSVAGLDVGWATMPTTRDVEYFNQFSVRKGQYHFSLAGRALQAGDVVLSRNDENPSKGTSFIHAYQKQVCRDPHWRWTHVGIVDQQYRIWDAMPNSKIRTITVTQVLRDATHIKVVRPRHPVPGDRLDDALHKFSESEYRMDLETSGRLGLRLNAVSPTGQTFTAKDDRNTICSIFVQNVLRHATGENWLAEHLIAVPADFSQSDEFCEVGLTLQKLQSDLGT